MSDNALRADAAAGGDVTRVLERALNTGPTSAPPPKRRLAPASSSSLTTRRRITRSDSIA